jgi:hypothetical protein
VKDFVEKAALARGSELHADGKDFLTHGASGAVGRVGNFFAGECFQLLVDSGTMAEQLH